MQDISSAAKISNIEKGATHLLKRDQWGRRGANTYIYCENELRPAISRELLTKDEARRIAANMAKLPQLVRKVD